MSMKCKGTNKMQMGFGYVNIALADLTNKRPWTLYQHAQQQQQQHSLFSQASWGRLEMKPERNKFKIKAH